MSKSDHLDHAANIWLTSKARMEAESRFALYDLTSHLILIWYSLWLLCLSVFSSLFEPYVGVVGIGELSVFLSASVLVISVSIWGFGFGAKSALYRDCYLEIDELLSSSLDASELQVAYRSILKKYPNHSPFDMDTVKYQRIYKNKEKLRNREGQVEFSGRSLVGFLLNRTKGQLFRVFLFLFPPLIAVLLYAF